MRLRKAAKRMPYSYSGRKLFSRLGNRFLRGGSKTHLLYCHIFYVFFLKYRVIPIAHIDSPLSNTCLIDCIPEQNYLVFEKITQKNF